MDQRAKQLLFWVVVLGSIGVLVLVILRPELAPTWSGVGQTESLGEGVEPAKTLWDWLQLLAIPIFLVGGVWWLGSIVRRTSEQVAQRRIEADERIAAGARHQATMESYFDKMTDLLINGGLRTAGDDATVRKIAQARTLAVLRSLDGRRKGQVLQFLLEAGLIGNTHIVNLRHADLSGAILPGANLRKACLWLVNLSGAELDGANLSGADLWLADLSRASLRGARMRGTHLGGANLGTADLTGADLTEASLRKANLNRANLTRATLTPEQLGRAHSYDFVTLPDGTTFISVAPTAVGEGFIEDTS